MRPIGGCGSDPIPRVLPVGVAPGGSTLITSGRARRARAPPPDRRFPNSGPRSLCGPARPSLPPMLRSPTPSFAKLHHADRPRMADAGSHEGPPQISWPTSPPSARCPGGRPPRDQARSSSVAFRILPCPRAQIRPRRLHSCFLMTFRSFQSMTTWSSPRPSGRTISRQIQRAGPRNVTDDQGRDVWMFEGAALQHRARRGRRKGPEGLRH